MGAFLLDGIYAAHDAINEYAMRKRMADPPRTTCVVCVVQKGMACWAHVGDSRLYHFSRRDACSAPMIIPPCSSCSMMGVISEAEMGTHPDRNKLYNSVGGYMLPDIELDQPVKLQDGDVLLSVYRWRLAGIDFRKCCPRCAPIRWSVRSST
jgi:PPM family protein phosphatase